MSGATLDAATVIVAAAGLGLVAYYLRCAWLEIVQGRQA